MRNPSIHAQINMSDTEKFIGTLKKLQLTISNALEGIEGCTRQNQRPNGCHAHIALLENDLLDAVIFLNRCVEKKEKLTDFQKNELSVFKMEMGEKYGEIYCVLFEHSEGFGVHFFSHCCPEGAKLTADCIKLPDTIYCQTVLDSVDSLLKGGEPTGKWDWYSPQHLRICMRLMELLSVGINSLFSAKPARKSAGRPRKAPRQLTCTFTYRYLDQEPARITRLYQALLKLQWIADDTSPDAFYTLFSGEDSDVRIQWMALPSQLRGLFDVLFPYLTWPSAHGQWQLVESHFVDSHRRAFSLLKSRRPRKKDLPAMRLLAQLLDPAAAR